MPPSAVCRACLASNVHMFSIADSAFQDKFEEITKIKVCILFCKTNFNYFTGTCKAF